MYQNKYIQYKAIFKQDGETQTIQYQEKGIYYMGEKTGLKFENSENTIDISYRDHLIWLKNGQSVLRLNLNQDMWNQYELPYGCVALKTRVRLFKANAQHIQLKYELYDEHSLISTVYILIRMSDMEDA